MTRNRRTTPLPVVPAHVFTLYVAGFKPASRRAVVNLQSFCKDHLPGRYRLHIVDISENPGEAREDNVVAVPTLIKSWPLPRQIFVGDLSNTPVLLSRLALGAL